MRKQYYKRIALCTGALFALMTTGGAGLNWREMQQGDLNRALIAAIKRVDAKATNALLLRGADANARDIPERTRGIHLKSRQGTPALLVAMDQAVEKQGMSRDDYQRILSIVKALLEHGANVRAKVLDGFDVVVMSMQCDNFQEMLPLLIRYHAPVNVHHPDGGYTPLMWAARNGEPEEIEMLIAAGARIDDRDNEGDTALMVAVNMARGDNVAALLAHHASVNIKDKAGKSALTMARTGLASNASTPFNHENQHETWSDIVRLLKNAGKHAGPDSR